MEASIPHAIITPAGTLTFNSALTLGQYALDTIDADMPNIRQDVNPLSGREGGIVQPAWNDPLYPSFTGLIIPTAAPTGQSKATMGDTMKSYLYSIQRADGTWQWTPSSGAIVRQRIVRLHIAPAIPEGAGADPFTFTLAAADPIAYNATPTYTGKNLIANPSLETNVNGYAASGSATLTRDTTTAQDGTANLKVVTGNVAAYEGWATTYNLIAGVPYTFSCWLKGSGTVVLQMQNTSGAWLGAASSPITVSGSWTRYSVTWTPPFTGAVKLMAITNSKQAATFYSDAIQLEVGSTATAYAASLIAFGGAAVAVTNQGNVPTYPIVRMFGPVTAPVVTNQLTGEVFTFGSGLVIADGAYVDFDMRLGSSKLSTDGSSQLSNLTIAGSTLWPLYVGSQNILATGTTPGANAGVQLIYRDAWA